MSSEFFDLLWRSRELLSSPEHTGLQYELSGELICDQLTRFDFLRWMDATVIYFAQ